ncbi:hypothetical protein ACI8AF_12345 [Blastococcus sp. SYSU D00669]
MTSPRPQTAAETDDPKAEEEKTKGGVINVVQVAAGALAAVSSAVLLSFFGVAGTLIGAALASVVSSVGAALYSSSLAKTNERLRKVLATGRTPRAAASAAEPAETEAAATAVLPAQLDPRRAPVRRFQPRWGRLAAYAVGVFAVAMGIITGIEVIGQQPVSAMVTSSSSSGTTTLGELADSPASSTTPAPSTPSGPSTGAPATSTAEEPAAGSSGSADEEAEPEGSEPAEPTGSTSSSTSTSSSSPSSSSPSSAPRTTQPAPLEATPAP